MNKDKKEEGMTPITVVEDLRVYICSMQFVLAQFGEKMGYELERLEEVANHLENYSLIPKEDDNEKK